MKEFLSIGQIINTHGVKGELKIYPLTDDVKRFRKLKKVFIDGKEENIVWCKLQPDRVIMKLEGIDSIEDGIKLKNKYLEVKREDAVKLPEDRYFIADIIGCKVWDENGKYIGKVFDVLQTKSNDVYWIKEEGMKEILIPALYTIVTDIDVKNEKITIKPVEEWLVE